MRLTRMHLWECVSKGQLVGGLSAYIIGLVSYASVSVWIIRKDVYVWHYHAMVPGTPPGKKKKVATSYEKKSK